MLIHLSTHTGAYHAESHMTQLLLSEEQSVLVLSTEKCQGEFRWEVKSHLGIKVWNVWVSAADGIGWKSISCKIWRVSTTILTTEDVLLPCLVQSLQQMHEEHCVVLLCVVRGQRVPTALC